MKTRVIAVGGPGGAAKSTLAEWLAHELSAPIIHTDDFAFKTVKVRRDPRGFTEIDSRSPARRLA